MKTFIKKKSNKNKTNCKKKNRSMIDKLKEKLVCLQNLFPFSIHKPKFSDNFSSLGL